MVNKATTGLLFNVCLTLIFIVSFIFVCAGLDYRWSGAVSME